MSLNKRCQLIDVISAYMKVLLLESFYGGSHKVWADQLQKIFGDELTLFTMKDRFWKWRMEASGLEFAKEYSKLNQSFDYILISSITNVAQFLAFANVDRTRTKVILYMHENQICYPWQSDRTEIDKKRDRHFGFINIMNCKIVDSIIFNSQFHKTAFINEVKAFLSVFPDFVPKWDKAEFAAKSEVLGIPLNIKVLLEKSKIENDVPVILWNHRWEYDKNPELFFQTLIKLSQKAYKFKLIIIGESYKKKPKIFECLDKELKSHIIHKGFVESKEAYYRLLMSSDIIAVTSNHEFFGISVVEALSCGVTPLLPNRLSYPEHINPELFPEQFYNYDEEFETKLDYIVSNWPRTRCSFADKMLKYDVSHLGMQYKAVLNKL